MAIILVTAAHGTTGRRVTQALIKKGHKVRAGVRNPNNSEHLKKMGAEIVWFDFNNPETFKEAMKGVERLVLISPVEKDIAKSSIALIDCAKSCGIKFIVKLSTVSADPKSTVNLSRYVSY